MTKPLEIVHRNFQIKIEQIENLLGILLELKLDCHTLNISFQLLKQDFDSQTLEILGEYYQSQTIEQKCQKVETFMQIVISKNYVSKLDQFIKDIKTIMVVQKVEITTNIVLKYTTYETTPIDVDVLIKEYTICSLCKTEMALFPAESELRCPNENCSFIMPLKGMTFDDTVHSSTDAGSLKRGAYETIRHCKYHLDRILGVKNPNLSQIVKDKIEEWMKINGYSLLRKTFKPKVCRRCLKDIGETKWNEFVPFICQMVTGNGPGRLFQDEMNKVYIYFDKAASAFKEIVGNDERANLKYYPFFIFKILEMILTNDVDRYDSIIENIHFQQEKTIISNDKIWQKICEIVPEFTFKKTDTNLFSF